MNSLPGNYYSCSPEVAPWIYGRFLNKEHKDGARPYIARSQPMTDDTKRGLPFVDSNAVRFDGTGVTVYVIP